VMNKEEASKHFLKLNGIAKKLRQLKYGTMGTEINDDVITALKSVDTALEKLTKIIDKK
jgi:hypothetical protein